MTTEEQKEYDYRMMERIAILMDGTDSAHWKNHVRLSKATVIARREANAWLRESRGLPPVPEEPNRTPI